MTISFNEYQQKAFGTAIYPDMGTGLSAALSYVTLGLNGEAGEVAEKIKKFIRGDHGPYASLTDDKFDQVRLEIMKELGDIMWYLAGLCTELDLNLEDVAQANLDKLASRKERGKIQGNGDNR
jgi:NTP pyrophosphatase (non-canonical NTP hydrolase)